jgi:hypothetical protein
MAFSLIDILYPISGRKSRVYFFLDVLLKMYYNKYVVAAGRIYNSKIQCGTYDI